MIWQKLDNFNFKAGDICTQFFQGEVLLQNFMLWDIFCYQINTIKYKIVILFTCRRNDKKSIWKLKTPIFSLGQIICLFYKCELHFDFSIGINRWLYLFFFPFCISREARIFLRCDQKLDWHLRTSALVFQVNVLVKISGKKLAGDKYFLFL